MKKYTLILIAIMSGSAFAAETKITSNELGTISSISWADGTVQVSSPSSTGGTTYTADEDSLLLTGTEFSANPASVTLQGNTFNGNSQLVQTTSDGKLPVIDGSNVTGITVTETDPVYSGSASTQVTSQKIINWDGMIPSTATGVYALSTTGNAATASALATAPTTCSAGQVTIGIDASGNAQGCWTPGGATYSADGVTLAESGGVFSAKSSSVTLQGNTFNGASQLVKLGSDGKLPAVDGSQLTNLPSSSGPPPPDVLFTRTAVASSADDATKDSQCSTELGSSYKAAQLFDVLTLMRGTVSRGTNADTYFNVARCATRNNFSTTYGSGIVWTDSAAATVKVACVRTDTQLRLSTTTAAFNATDAAKDAVCVNEFGITFQAAQASEISSYGQIAGFGSSSGSCSYPGLRFNVAALATYSLSIGKSDTAATTGIFTYTGGTYPVVCRKNTN